ncbi:MAG: tetratricopeptide repeat protein [Cyanobacteria bacterium P01_A01_bin.123]
MRHPARLLGLATITALLITTLPTTLSALPITSVLAQEASQIGDRQVEADRLMGQGAEQYNMNQFQTALQSWEQALAIYQEIEDRGGEGAAFGNLALAYYGLGQYEKAIGFFEKHLEIAREISDLQGEASALNGLSRIHKNLGNYQQAIDFYQQQITLARNTEDRQEEVNALGNLGIAYNEVGNYERAIESFEQSLTIARDIDDFQAQATVLGGLGVAHRKLENYQQAIEFHEQALVIARGSNNQDEEFRNLANLALAYNLAGEYQQAITFNEQALYLARELGDASSEVIVLGNLGIVYRNLGQYEQAIELYEQQLTIARANNNRQGERNALGNLGFVYSQLEQYQQAIDVYLQQIPILQALEDIQGESQALTRLGNMHIILGQYSEAIDTYKKLLANAYDNSDSRQEITTLNSLGEVYSELGDYQQSLENYEQSLAIADDLDNSLRSTFIRAVPLFGIVQANLGLQNYQEAILLAERALPVFDEILLLVENDQDLVGTIMSEQDVEFVKQARDILEEYITIAQEIFAQADEGASLDDWNSLFPQYQQAAETQYQQTIDFYQQRLVTIRQAGDRAQEASLLGNLGSTYRRLGRLQQAIDAYEQQLAITSDIEDVAGQGDAFSGLGRVFNAQDQPELAIVFLKSSVQVRESIRENIQGLETRIQEAYTNTIANDYRLLADLLLEQGRIPEAQQVLDLLKLEELREFTNTRATWTGSELAYTAAEQSVIDAHGSLIALGSAILTCEDTNCAELNSLYDQREALTAQYNDQVNQFANTIRANRRDDEDFQNPQELSDDAKSLLSAYAVEGQTPVLIYPFVLEDKLWLVWAIEGRVIGSAEVSVTQSELATTVQRFGELLTAPTRLDELQAQGQQLYNWIIQPLEAELAANNIDHLIFVNDRVTRYIPMAALYDGEQFLAERYQISTVLTPGTTDTRSRLADVESSQVLGLGLTQAVANFNPLPAVATELDRIVQSGDDDAIGIYPGQVLLNEAFTLEALKANLRPDYQVLHLATHAAFVPGRADESFIVMGNGDRLTTADIEDMNARLDNLHLVILSACQTAVGGPAGDGAEITGISSYFLGTDDSRAETVIASLWAVNDNSTSVLMQRFYTLLATGELTKAEALRQAQLSLLYEEDAETRLAAARRGAPIPTAREGFDVAVVEPGYRHPYYWAPFILIGNGL